MDDILQILKADARTSVPDIAAMTGRSEEDVAAAIEKYEKDGTILRYKAIVNTEKTGEVKEVVRAWIAVNVTPQREAGFDAIAERLYQFDEVRSCYLLSGSFDLLLLIQGESLQNVASFVSERLATLDDVTGTSTYFLLKAYKEDGDILSSATDRKRLAVTP